MKRVAVITVLTMVAAGTVYGAVVSVGGFYALSLPVGGENFDQVGTEYDADSSVLCFGGKFSVGGMSGLNFDYGFGYNTKYSVFSEGRYEWYWSAIPITSGVSYKFDLDPVKPYFGIGGAYVIMGAHYKDPYYGSEKDRFCYPGAYLGGGIIYPFADIMALDVNPRYMAAIDPDDGAIDFWFFDLLVGVNFYL
jgi:hypothetical protein